MNIVCEKGSFDLPLDFTIDVTHSNVMLSNVGDMSAPISLPPTPNNLMLVGYSSRLDSVRKPVKEIIVSVIEGVFTESGKLIIDSVSNENGISGTIFYGIASFYSLIDTRRLKSIDLPVKLFFATGSIEERRNIIVDICNKEYFNPTAHFPYRVAMVNTDASITWVDGSKDIQGNIIINELDGDFYTLKSKYYRYYKEGDAKITVAPTYAVSPQLKMRYVISMLFNSFGFSLDDNEIIDRYPNYAQNYVLVNNVADACYAGECNAAQLVPDVDIKEFISEVEKLFNGKFFIDDVQKKATFRFFDTVYLAEPDADLTEHVRSVPELVEFNFCDILINDEESTADNTRKIEIKIPSTKNIDFNGRTITDILSLSGVTHPNSTIRINGKEDTKQEKKSDNSEVVFGEVIHVALDGTPFFRIIDRVGTVRYGDEQSISYSTKDMLKDLYSKRKVFERDSNIGVSLKMDIPVDVLSQMDIASKKMISGQPYFIESIGRIVGDDKLMDVKLRTVRNYD